MKVLITGGNGQLGRALTKALLGHEVIALSRTQLDITMLNLVREALAYYHPDIVINTAAYTNVDGAETEQESAYRVNAVGPRNLAIVTAKAGVALMHISTDYVFDGTGKRPLHEFDPVNPQSVYGLSKLAGEQQVVLFNRRHYIVRTAWLYDNDGRNFPLTMLAQARKHAVAHVSVVDDQHGSPTYAPHLANALARLMQTDAYGVYHLAGQGATTWYDLTCQLYRGCAVSVSVRPVKTEEFPRPAPRPAYSVLTTVQDPQILLPQWEEGLAGFIWVSQKLKSLAMP